MSIPESTLTENERKLTAVFLEVMGHNREAMAAVVGLVDVAYRDLCERRPEDAQARLGELLGMPMMAPFIALAGLQRARASGAVN